MKKSLALLRNGFESSSTLTPDFAQFFRTFKSEFGRELKDIGATDIVFHRGHFYISGFFSKDGKAFYFSISDVRGFSESSNHFSSLLYRTAKNYKDYTGGTNQYVKIEPGMTLRMNI